VTTNWLIENQLTDNVLGVFAGNTPEQAIDAAYQARGWASFADARAKRATAAEEHEIVARRLDSKGKEVGPFFHYVAKGSESRR
jgi:hypothetical protein